MTSVGRMTEHIVVLMSPTTLFNQQTGVADNIFFHFSQTSQTQCVYSILTVHNNNIVQSGQDE